jgi:hypothetical protein
MCRQIPSGGRGASDPGRAHVSACFKAASGCAKNEIDHARFLESFAAPVNDMRPGAEERRFATPASRSCEKQRASDSFVAAERGLVRRSGRPEPNGRQRRS